MIRNKLVKYLYVDIIEWDLSFSVSLAMLSPVLELLYVVLILLPSSSQKMGICVCSVETEIN